MKTKNLLIVLIITATGLQANSKPYKKYLVENGTVLYEITGSGNIMGATQKVSGKKRLIFDSYGYNEMTEEVSAQKMNVMGHKQIDKTHKLTLIQGTTVKSVDFKHKKIYESTPPSMSLLIAASNQNLAQMGEKMLKQMGGHKTGTDTVLGYKCDIWKMTVATQCIYKGVPLWIKTNVMGIKRVEKAIKAKFDNGSKVIPSKLPNYKVIKMSNSFGGGVPSMKEPSAKDMEALGKALQAGMSGQKNAGVASGQKPTPSQQHQMQNAIAQAMLPAMKQEIRQKHVQLVKDRKCVANADTLAELKTCAPKGARGLPTTWNMKEKEKTLKDIDTGLKAMDCMLKANSMVEIQKCQPQ